MQPTMGPRHWKTGRETSMPAEASRVFSPRESTDRHAQISSRSVQRGLSVRHGGRGHSKRRRQMQEHVRLHRRCDRIRVDRLRFL